MAKNTQKDKMMAAALKAAGVKRTGANCPICHRFVSLSNLYYHVAVVRH